MKLFFIFVFLLGFWQNASAAEDSRFKACQKRLIEASQLGVFHDIKYNNPPYIVIGPTFYDLTIDKKKSIISDLNCFLTAGKDEYINFDVLDWKTGKAIGRYYFGKFEMN